MAESSGIAHDFSHKSSFDSDTLIESDTETETEFELLSSLGSNT